LVGLFIYKLYRMNRVLITSFYFSLFTPSESPIVRLYCGYNSETHCILVTGIFNGRAPTIALGGNFLILATG
jgi:hypothetical protein